MTPDPADPYTSLRLAQIVVPVRIGWNSAERQRSQPVAIDLDIRFQEPPGACESDEVSGTIDYAELVERVTQLCEEAEFRLIERLASTLYHAIRARLPKTTGLAVTVTKRPPLAMVEGGASFRIGDWPSKDAYA